MTIINPNSISGISSITALNSTDAINLFKADGTSANVIAGVATASTLRLPDNTSGSVGRLQIGNGLDLSLFHDGTNSFLVNNSGWLSIQSQDGVNGIFIARNAEVNLYYGSSVRMQTSSAGITVNRDLDVDGHTNLDNVSIAGVTTASGNLKITGGTLSLDAGGSERFNVAHVSGGTVLVKNPSNAALNFGTNNLTRIQITNDGKVQIGLPGNSTSLPGGTEVVNIRAMTNGNLHIRQIGNIASSPTGTGVGIDVLNDASNTVTDLAIRGSTVIFKSATTETLRIGSNGYVNIGTGTAEQQLTVQNSAQHSIIRVISKNTHDAGIDFGDTDDTDIAGVRYSNSDNSLKLNANAATRVKIDSGGRVMIGGGSSPSQVGDGRLIVYSTDRLHPAIKPAGMSNNYANGYTMIGDNYTATESQVNLGVSYSSAGLVLSRSVKVSDSADDTYLSSQAQFATRPSAIKLDSVGAFNFLTTETNANTAVDSAVTLTEVFKIDRVGNVYQKISGRDMYFGASGQLRIGVQSNGDPNIEAVNGNLKIMDSGSTIMQLRDDGFEMKQDIYFGTAGKGIVLGNTSNVDANTLDDYEEGTATFALHIGGSEASGVSYSYNTAPYVKVGRMVWCAISMFATSVPTDTGVIDIVGLPFTDGGGGGYREPAFLAANHGGVSPSGTVITGALHGNNTKIRIRKNGNEDLNGSDIGSTFWMHGHITYKSST